MEAALVSLMLADPGIAALVGTRINWGVYPQGIASPAIRLSRIGGAVGHHMQGTDGLDGAQVQIDVRATAARDEDAAGFGLAYAAAQAVEALLNGFKGEHAGTLFQGCFLTAKRATAEKSDSALHHTMQLDFDIWSSAST